ncbi:MAG TPA: sigma-70 family RNA polymerase sigma factor [Gammaproteobacteria bacterium]|nr:sigma-70 family RNA polymerase sigma factor [Gammaproteobacteria bacterium]
MEETFAQLYAAHYRRVFGLCRRMLRRPEQAEDAAQEVFLRAYRAFDSYDPSQPFSRWIMTIAARHCVDVVRRRSKERELFADEQAETPDRETEADPTVGPLLSAENARDVKAAVDALPDKYRVPLLLAYYNEASYDEIAASLGITRNHVGILLLRGKRALRAALAATERENMR